MKVFEVKIWQMANSNAFITTLSCGAMAIFAKNAGWPKETHFRSFWRNAKNEDVTEYCVETKNILVYEDEMKLWIEV